MMPYRASEHHFSLVTLDVVIVVVDAGGIGVLVLE